MKGSMKAKRHIVTTLWGVSCLVLAGVMWARCVSPVQGCTQQDLKTAAADPWAVQTVQAQADGQAQAKRVYLTFDDGPSATTETVLDVLKEKGVNATFFVIAAENNRDHLPVLKRTVSEGNEIALHSCTHEYREIYASAEAYWADLKELRQQLAPYVDVAQIHWLRFPGGSTNTVSHRYGGSEIMKTLKRQAAEKGYRYLDWNVCAEDAVGGHPSAREIYENVIGEAKGQSTCVVLMHDTKSTKTTAQALPDIIDWFRENGYEFCTVSQMPPENSQ